MTTVTYPGNWQARVEFYGAKYEAYKQRSPDRWPTKRTIRRWVGECNETIIQGGTQNATEKTAAH